MVAHSNRARACAIRGRRERRWLPRFAYDSGAKSIERAGLSREVLELERRSPPCMHTEPYVALNCSEFVNAKRVNITQSIRTQQQERFKMAPGVCAALFVAITLVLAIDAATTADLTTQDIGFEAAFQGMRVQPCIMQLCSSKTTTNLRSHASFTFAIGFRNVAAKFFAAYACHSASNASPTTPRASLFQPTSTSRRVSLERPVSASVLRSARRHFRMRLQRGLHVVEQRLQLHR